MTTPDFGVTPEGFKTKRLVDIKTDLEQSFIAEFSEVNLDPQSVIGQIIGIFSKDDADIWENMQDVYLSQYPNSASGISLDNIASIVGIVRIPEQQTKVIGVVSGIEGTFIPINSLAKIPTSEEIFYSIEDGLITRSKSVQNIVEVLALAPQSYVIVIDSNTYFYNLITMNFSAPFILGNVISVRLNGVNLTPVSFITDSATTITNLRNVLFATGNFSSAVVVGNTIELVPTLGKQNVINSVGISGGGVTYSETLRTPLDYVDIVSNLTALLNTNAKISAIGNTPLIIITALDTARPYNIIVGSNLQINQTSSPINFLAQNYGAIPAPANSLTEIMTPIAGWETITNFQAGATGREQETDAELRIRIFKSSKLGGLATVEAIRAKLLQEVPNVTSVTIFENVTLTKSPIEITFTIDFVTGNIIEIKGDGLTIGTVPFTTDQLTTMNLIKNVLLARPEIETVTIGGTGNKKLTISFKEMKKLNIDFVISGGVSSPTYTISGGRPPKSFEAIVDGGTNQDIALKIWQTKPAGIETWGNVPVIIQDSQGNDQAINFSRATIVYIWVKMTITLNPQETFPTNGFLDISNEILAYGNSLGVGLDVIRQRIESLAFLTQGVATASVTLAKTYNLVDAPNYLASDIDIGTIETSSFDLSRISVGI